jgi:hypothetical protein
MPRPAWVFRRWIIACIGLAFATNGTFVINNQTHLTTQGIKFGAVNEGASS